MYLICDLFSDRRLLILNIVSSWILMFRICFGSFFLVGLKTNPPVCTVDGLAFYVLVRCASSFVGLHFPRRGRWIIQVVS
jgi:hypothetical protein